DIIKQLVLWVETEERKTALVSSVDFSAFVYAADRGYIEIIEYIWESLPALLHSQALAASNFAAYRLATKNHHTSIIAFFEANSSEKTINKMKKAVTQGVFPPNNNDVYS